MNSKTGMRPLVVASMMMFFAMFIITTVVCTVVWEYATANLYDCTDPGLPGYLNPGGWVHPWSHYHIAVVHQIVHGRSMSEPDTIKEGWSIARLWCLWISFLTGSILVSLAFARLPWLWFRFMSKRIRVFPPPNMALQVTAGTGENSTEIDF